MISSEPLVSVIVATYRREKSLRDALESLACQSYRNFEIIVVDDNDDSIWNEKVRQCVNDFCGSVNKIKYLENHPNLGSARARDAGIALAEGEYVTFLDDDDVYLPDKIELQLKHMIENASDYSVTDLYLYDEKGKLCDLRKRYFLPLTDDRDLMQRHLMHHITGTDTMMFRLKYLILVGGFGTKDLGDEFYLICRAIEGGGRFSYLPGCSVKATGHSGNGENLSGGRRKLQGENDLYGFKKRYFENYDRDTVRYIKMRHYATMAFTYLRMRHLVGFGFNSLLALLIHPSGCLNLFFDRLNVLNHNGENK